MPDIATLQRQRDAESQPARTHKDEQLKYAQHVDPQQEHRENGDSQGDNRDRAPNIQENNGRQGYNQQKLGAREQTVLFQPGRNTKTSHSDNPFLALLFLHSFACRVKPDLYGNDTSQ